MNEVEKYITYKVKKAELVHPEIISEELLSKAIQKYSNSELDDVKVEIDRKLEKYVEQKLKENNRKKEILEKQKSIYIYDETEEQESTKIQSENIQNYSPEELDKLCFHYSLKKEENSIATNGLRSKIGRNSEGVDEKQAVYFSYGIEAVLQTWDVWLKWRLNRLNNPQWNEENKEIKELIKNETATDEQKREFYYSCKKWEEEFLSKEYKQDKEKLNFLYDFELDEMNASNYYVLDLHENEDFTLDEIDVKKQKNREVKGTKRNVQYEMMAEMYGEYSDLNSDVADKWNMNTILGKKITIDPSRIKHLELSEGKNDVYSILEYIYDSYQKNPSKDKKVEFDLLDDYMQYCKEKDKTVEKRVTLQGIGKGTIKSFNSNPEKAMKTMDMLEHGVRTQEKEEIKQGEH